MLRPAASARCAAALLVASLALDHLGRTGATNAAAAASTPEPGIESEGSSRPRFFTLQPTWNDGLQYRFGRFREPPDRPRLFPGSTFVSGRAGFRFHLDAAAFDASGKVEDAKSDTDLRRAFVNVGGDVALRWPVRFYFEFGVLKEKAYLDRGWFDIRRPGGELVLTVGQFYAPLGLEQLSSSNTITMLERAQPVKAFAPGNKAGIQLARKGDHDLTWAFGGFTDTQRTDEADESDGPLRVVGRVVWVPRSLLDPERHHLVHLGGAGSYVLSDPADIRYKATAESAIAPALVDTGTLDAAHAWVHGLELAIQRGPLLVQSEYLGSLVAGKNDGSAYLWGGYVTLAAMLTGEARPYDRDRGGAFGMPVPAVPVSFRERRWRGAWELAMRYSYLDLDDARVEGGRDHAISVGLNWYWNRHVRVLVDYGLTVVRGDKPNGTLQVAQTRLQLVY